MFQNWGFLVTEMVTLIVLAVLLGLFVGWLLWGRRIAVDGYVNQSQIQADLAACKAEAQDKDQQIAKLAARVAAAEAMPADPNSEEPETQKPASAEIIDFAASTGDTHQADAVPDESDRPQALGGPRDGGADDLKQIKGIGPKLEVLCHDLGFYHFDQIAAWTEAEVAWVDDNLEGFKGRVTRDDWVAQAKVLAAGGRTEFSERVRDGDVY